jgi:hypothetical protein
MEEKKAPEGHDQAKCPKCGHTFWHKVTDAFKKAADGLGNAIGETKFGGD